MEHRLIFVGGAPRSGTTLVQNMLDSHPEILGGPEFLHIPDIIALGKKLHRSVDRGWISLFCSHEEVDDRIRALILDFLLPLLEGSGYEILSEKTPGNVLVFPKLGELFPEAKFIHVLRDPRGTVASLLEVGRRGRACGEEPARYTANAISAAKYVRRCLLAGLAADRATPGRVFHLHYESLVQDTREEVARLCAFLEVPVARQMERPGDREHLGAEAITVNSQGVWYDRETYYSNPSTHSIDKWRTQLSRHQQSEINRLFRGRSELEGMGYDFGPPKARWRRFPTGHMGARLGAARSFWQRTLQRRG